MRWTTRKPADGGYYWYRDDRNDKHIVFITWCGSPQIPRHLRLVGPHMDIYGGKTSVSDLNGEWGSEVIMPPNV